MENTISYDITPVYLVMGTGNLQSDWDRVEPRRLARCHLAGILNPDTTVVVIKSRFHSLSTHPIPYAEFVQRVTQVLGRL